MSQREYARHRGVHHRSVQKALAAGRILAAADGRIDSDAADAAWARNTNDAMRRDVATAPKVATQGRQEAPIQAPVAGGPSYATARAVKETFSAKIKQLDYEERSAKLLPAAEVEEKWARALSNFRNEIIGLPTKMRSIVPSMTDFEFQEVTALVHETLMVLSAGAAEDDD